MSLYKKDVIEMHQNVNTLAKNKYVTAALHKAVDENNFMKYPDPTGFEELKELILKDLGLKNLEVLITAGATPALELTFRSLIEEKYHEVMTTDPGYLMIDWLASNYGVINTVDIWEYPYKLTPEKILKQLHDDTKFLLLVDPMNPSGAHYSETELKKIAYIAEKYDLIVIHDVTYMGFDKDHYSIAKIIPERTITIYSTSKMYGMAGMRIGALVTNKTLMDKIWPNVIDKLGVNALGQEAAIEALKTKDIWFGNVDRITRYNHKLLVEKLSKFDGVKIVNPDDNRASMMIIDISETGIDPAVLDEKLQFLEVYIRAGHYTSKLNGHKYFRISFSNSIKDTYDFIENFTIVYNRLTR
jgi:aspartate/methionine/tyrosine aminotransferase